MLTVCLYVSVTKAEIIRLTKQVLQAIADWDYETYIKLVSPELTCFEPEAIGNMVVGLEFHKYFFDNGRKCPYILRIIEFTDSELYCLKQLENLLL